jgi:hypothetical protein
MDVIFYALFMLVPIHGAFWYGVRQERKKIRMLYILSMKRRR